MKPSKTIWVFRTSVFTHMDIHRVKPLLDRLMQTNDKWNFDLEDVDHILRVVTMTISAVAIIAELEKLGYRCEELEDTHSLSFGTIPSPELVTSLVEKTM